MHSVSLRNVSKKYHLVAVPVAALADVSLDIGAGRFTVIAGPSGSGKTSLLNLIGCIDRPDQGQLSVAGRDVQAMTDDQLSDFRARHLGFVFQNFNLLPVLTAYENIEYPLLLTGVAAPERRRRVKELVEAGAWPIASITCRVSCRAASASAWPSHARWPGGRPWCWPTNRRPTSTARRAPPSSR